MRNGGDNNTLCVDLPPKVVPLKFLQLYDYMICNITFCTVFARMKILFLFQMIRELSNFNQEQIFQ